MKDCFVQIHMMTKYLVKAEYQNEKEVPDPFHGGPENFERVSLLPLIYCHGTIAASVYRAKHCTEQCD